MINKQDLYSVLDANVLDAYAAATVTEIIQQQYHIIQQLLPAYDWEALEALPSANRPHALIKYLKDQVLYALLLSHAQSLPATVQARYEEATKFFEAIRTNQISPDWPKKNPSRPK